ncbi:uncharacterized protein METZ01_LOCUS433356, partial [marine metagenome]
GDCGRYNCADAKIWEYPVSATATDRLGGDLARVL